MKRLTQLYIENPMDIIIAHKRTIKAGEMLRLSLSVQTTFTTAISEVARVLLDKVGAAFFNINIKKEAGNYVLIAIFEYEAAKYINETEFSYAKKLVKTFEFNQAGPESQILISLDLPGILKISDLIIDDAIHYFREELPGSFYEEVKNQKLQYSRDAEKASAQLTESKEINEKKNEFLAIASHELRTPLSILKGFTALALTETDPQNTALRSYLAKIDQQAGKLNRLIQQMLDISKVEAGQLDFTWEQVSINDYLLAEMESIKMILPDNKIHIELDENVVVKIDKLRMEQVLSNLFNNASKYAEKNTVIYFSTKLEPGGTIYFAIKDEGIGMTEDTKAKVFDKFYRADNVTKKYSGLGMGLYITSKIITEHAGKIWIESAEGKGSTFMFSLPYLFKAKKTEL